MEILASPEDLPVNRDDDPEVPARNECVRAVDEIKFVVSLAPFVRVAP